MKAENECSEQNNNSKTLVKDYIVSRIWFYMILIVIIIALSGIKIFMIRENNKKTDDSIDKYFPAIKVIVQNGCGFAGVANNVKNSLSNHNIDVISVNNARKFVYDDTLIVVKHNDEDDLKRLKSTTGIENVIYAINENYLVPFIIIAGKDYQKYFYLIQ